MKSKNQDKNQTGLFDYVLNAFHINFHQAPLTMCRQQRSGS